MKTPRPVSSLMLLVIAGAGLVSWGRMGLLNLAELAAALTRLGAFASDLFPPHTAALPTLMRAMLETVEIAFAGTLLGFCFSLPLAFLGTRGLFASGVTALVRLLIGAVRTVPSILWGVVFVVAFGLGPSAGVAGVALYTVGYLGKLYYEAFEAVDVEVLEAVKSTSRNQLQLFAYAILPESANAVLSQLLFMFEYNIRASAILGFVGAGGIGYYMLGYVQMLQYRHLLTAILLTFAVVMVVDYLSLKLRGLMLPTGMIR
jgi:phosphonate transport system permease protein